ncbi:MAG: sulfatase [Acidobacteria bacterium]|nr:sulfatase [Acidobacteriota bacterium]
MIGRREFVGALAGAAAARGQQGRKPNFVMIFADDLGYGDVGCYGNKYQTPNLDRMAAEGVRFTDFYVPMPFCAPSRAALLTGRYPFRCGMTSNPAPDGGINDLGLAASEITIAEMLKPLGYSTMAIGKWHLGHTPRFLPRTQGFDEYYGILYSNDMRPVQIVHNERVAQYPVVQANLTRDYTRHAVDFIERNRERPFFLYLPHAMPHKPLAASDDFYKPGTAENLYGSVIRELDWGIGRILSKLRELNLERDTLVLFASDNGPWFGGSTAGLRGMKGSTFDGGIRVPLIARWPGRIPAGRVCREIATSVDIFPTIGKLAGGKLPGDRILDGLDIFPLMSGESAKTPHEAIFAMGGNELRVVRSGKWKLHVRVPTPGQTYTGDPAKWVDPRAPDGVTLIAPWEQARPDLYPGVRTGDPAREMMLFDLEADRSEQHDVAAQHPDVVQRLKGYWDRIAKDVPPPRPRGRSGPRGLRRLKGGELRYDLEAGTGHGPSAR